MTGLQGMSHRDHRGHGGEEEQRRRYLKEKFLCELRVLCGFSMT